MIRRGFLGALVGAGAALTRKRQAAASVVVANHVNPALSSLDGDDGVALSSSAFKPGSAQKWDLLNQLTETNRRGRRRQKIARDLLGGYPPGVACHHSCAPWFKAMMAAKRIEADEQEYSTWYDKIQKKVFGD